MKLPILCPAHNWYAGASDALRRGGGGCQAEVLSKCNRALGNDGKVDLPEVPNR